MASKIPLEKISVLVSPIEKQQLQDFAEERGESLSATARRIIQTYLMALQKKRVKRG